MGLNLFCWFGALCMSASVVHLSRKNPMGGVCGGGKIIPRFPQLWGVWGRGAVFESCLDETNITKQLLNASHYSIIPIA